MSPKIFCFLLCVLTFRWVEGVLPQSIDGPTSQFPTFTLVGSSQSLSRPADDNDASLGDCSQICEDIDSVCIGILWLPHKPQEPTTLAGEALGKCWALDCVPEEGPGPGRLYFVLTSDTAPAYGLLETESGYIRGCTYAFKHYNEKKNFSDAMEVCERDGGRLMFMRNREQHDLVNTVIVRSNPHWIGLTTDGKTRRFSWLDGSKPRGYSEWGKNQPNNFHPKDVTEDQNCVILHNGVWNDDQCSNKHNFLCQIVFTDI